MLQHYYFTKQLIYLNLQVNYLCSETFKLKFYLFLSLKKGILLHFVKVSHLYNISSLFVIIYDLL